MIKTRHRRVVVPIVIRKTPPAVLRVEIKNVKWYTRLKRLLLNPIRYVLFGRWEL